MAAPVAAQGSLQGLRGSGELRADNSKHMSTILANISDNACIHPARSDVTRWHMMRFFQDLARIQLQHQKEQEQLSHRAVALSEALTREKHLNHQLEHELKGSEERLKAVMESEARAREAETGTMRQMYEHAVKVRPSDVK
jgi:small-conductance mechanosensitive channel